MPDGVPSVDTRRRAPRASEVAWRCAIASAILAVWSMGLAGAGGCGGRSPVIARDRQLAATVAPTVRSNVLRRDYVGSAACGPCHGDVVSAWRGSPMHRMTRLPERTDLKAPFDGRTFRFKGDVAVLEQVRGTHFMRLLLREGGARVYRVTRVIGGRYREDFAGLEVASADPEAPVLGDPGAELILPVSYVFQNASFRLKGYSVMVGERPGLRAGGVWNQTCIFCHNTVPYFDDLWGALHGPGAPGYQGEVVDRVMPAERRMRYEITDTPALLKALEEEIVVLGGTGGGDPALASSPSSSPSATSAATTDPLSSDEPRATLRRAIAQARTGFRPAHFVEIGIGCESCHGGSREHVDDPRLHPTFEPRAAFLSVEPAAGTNAPLAAAEWQNRACARCHQVLFTRYSRTWEGGLRRGPGDAGGSHITSGEARDFLLGGCARTMSCSTCHDPHREDSADALARLATPEGNKVCTSCHPAFATAAALKAHAHHEPTGAGAACVACHMPRKNMGLGYALTRYHRIGSPTDTARVQGDRPLECALCHASKSVGTLLDDMARFWGKQYDRAAIARLYGSLDANPLVATIDRGHAHEQATAMGAAGEQRFLPARRAIARQSNVNPYPLVRYYAAAALAAIEGRPVPADLEGGGATNHVPTPAGPSPSPASATGEGETE